MRAVRHPSLAPGFPPSPVAFCFSLEFRLMDPSFEGQIPYQTFPPFPPFSVIPPPLSPGTTLPEDSVLSVLASIFPAPFYGRVNYEVSRAKAPVFSQI